MSEIDGRFVTRLAAAVIAAFQNVADTLYAIAADAQTERAAAMAEQAAANSLDFAHRQLELGQVDRYPHLMAHQAHQQTSIALILASTTRFVDTITLFAALGGGWQKVKEVTNA